MAAISTRAFAPKVSLQICSTRARGSRGRAEMMAPESGFTMSIRLFWSAVRVHVAHHGGALAVADLLGHRGLH
jgi:hypothetical protein